MYKAPVALQTTVRAKESECAPKVVGSDTHPQSFPLDILGSTPNGLNSKMDILNIYIVLAPVPLQTDGIKVQMGWLDRAIGVNRPYTQSFYCNIR